MKNSVLSVFSVVSFYSRLKWKLPVQSTFQRPVPRAPC